MLNKIKYIIILCCYFAYSNADNQDLPIMYLPGTGIQYHTAGNLMGALVLSGHNNSGIRFHSAFNRIWVYAEIPNIENTFSGTPTSKIAPNVVIGARVLDVGRYNQIFLSVGVPAAETWLLGMNVIVRPHPRVFIGTSINSISNILEKVVVEVDSTSMPVFIVNTRPEVSGCFRINGAEFLSKWSVSAIAFSRDNTWGRTIKISRENWIVSFNYAYDNNLQFRAEGNNQSRRLVLLYSFNQ